MLCYTKQFRLYRCGRRVRLHGHLPDFGYVPVLVFEPAVHLAQHVQLLPRFVGYRLQRLAAYRKVYVTPPHLAELGEYVGVEVNLVFRVAFPVLALGVAYHVPHGQAGFRYSLSYFHITLYRAPRAKF